MRPGRGYVCISASDGIAKGCENWGLPPEDDEVVAWKVASLREAGTTSWAG